MQNFYNALMYGYAEMKAQGWSYAAIAKDINYDCLVNLCGAIKNAPDLKQPVIDIVEFSNAFNLLKSLQMKDRDILGYLIPALEDIHQGRSPWNLDSGPVDAQRVRDALRQWSHKQKVKKVVVKAPPKCENVALKELARINEERTKKANALLEGTYPDSLQNYFEFVKETFLNFGYSGVIEGRKTHSNEQKGEVSNSGNSS